MKRALFLLLFASAAAGQDATETATKITADPGQSSVLAQSVGQVTLSSSQDATDVKAEFGIERRRRTGFLVASLRLQAQANYRIAADKNAALKLA